MILKKILGKKLGAENLRSGLGGEKNVRGNVKIMDQMTEKESTDLDQGRLKGAEYYCLSHLISIPCTLHKASAKNIWMVKQTRLIFPAWVCGEIVILES